MAAQLIDHVRQRVLLLDGAMGTSVQAASDLTADDYLGCENCTEMITRSRPEILQRIHESFLEVGADIVETNTFGASALTLGEFGHSGPGEVEAFNREAAQIARAACESYSTVDRPRFVAGSIGPGTKLVSLGQTGWDEMLASYTRQAVGLLEGGVDCFLIETCQDLLQCKCVVNACLAALAKAGRSPDDVPIFVSVTMETTGTMLLGTEIEAAVTALRQYPIAGLGLNCATGPREMGEHLAWLSKHWDRLLTVAPNAGLPVMIDGKAQYPLGPEAFANTMADFVERYGINMVGGCCGTTPDHIAQLARKLGTDTAPVAIPTNPGKPAVSSLYSAVDLKQDTSFLIIGERTNANGSRKFKRLLDAEDWDGLVSMAKEQIRDGSHMLDVCVDFVGRDGVADITEVVGRYTRQVTAPLMIDSTEATVIEAALKLAGGRCLVNSINLEDGESRFDAICPLLQQFGAGAVALTIDEHPEEGMAKTAQRKLEIAQRMHRLYTEKWGLDPTGLLFDPLTFTIATGNESDRRLALETLDGIERISSAFPECGIVLGVSNVSFGLKPAARHVLNSVFLHEALERGLTAAIVHASKIRPRNRIPDAHWNAALDLIYDRRAEDHDPLTSFMALFEDDDDAAHKADGVAENGTAWAELSIDDRLRRHIIDGEREHLEEDLAEALLRYTPLEIINDHLLDGMRVVGELFGSGKMQLPFVLESAQVMKASVAILEPYMDKAADGSSSSSAKACIVLATVKGDVHDIGKNLVDIILSNNGFKVVNLGIKQPIATVISALEEHEADAIGLSGLLVKSVGVMEEDVQELNRRQLKVPVLLGGAALTRTYAESHLRDVYHGPLYYGKDAFEGLRILNALADGTLTEVDRQIERRREQRARRDSAGAGATSAACNTSGTSADTTDRASSVDVIDEDGNAVESDRAPVAIPTPPFWGTRVVESVPLKEVYAFINKVALFRAQWGFRKGAMSSAEYARSIADQAEPIFSRLQQEFRENKTLAPAVVYGYFPVRSDGDAVIVYDPDDHGREVERFDFPRQNSRGRRCISDYFQPVNDATDAPPDVLGVFVCTVGKEVGALARYLFESDKYSEYLYTHGLGVESAEALAELWHKRMRQELAIDADDATDIRKLFGQKYRGSRYSFGYPACPEMSDQERLFRLLKPERIGCALTENYQIDPEQSVSALVVHHPAAKYFNT